MDKTLNSVSKWFFFSPRIIAKAQICNKGPTCSTFQGNSCVKEASTASLGRIWRGSSYACPISTYPCQEKGAGRWRNLG